MEHDLLEWGLSANETKLYLSLVRQGRSTAAQLSRRSGISRTTTYSVLESLGQKGLVSQEKSKQVTYFVANPPASLMRGLAEERARLKHREELARMLQTRYERELSGRARAEPRFLFFNGAANVEGMLYGQLDAWRQSIRGVDDVWWGYQDPSFVDAYMPWLEHAWKTSYPREKIKLLSHESPTEIALKGQVPGREIRFLPARLGLTSTIWVLGEFMVMIMTNHEPHYAFQNREAEFASNLRSFVRLIWETQM